MDAFVKEVQRFITEETKLGQTGLAKICDYSVGVISAFLAQKYTGDVERVRTRMGAAMDLYRTRAASQLPEQYVRTSQGLVIEKTITYALRHKQSAAVLAESGCGKSMTARHVAAAEWGVVYVACDTNDFRQAAFLDRLADALGEHNGRPQGSWRLQRRLQAKLKDTEWVIVVDDAHYLLNPSNPGRSISLDVVKDLQANAGTPFVLLGVPELWQTIAHRVRGDWYAQLKRRLGTVQHIRASQIHADDVEQVVRSLAASCGAAVLRTLTELARSPGGYGNVEKCVRWATKEGGKQVSVQATKQYLEATSNAIVKVNTQEEPPPDGSSRTERATAVA
jgi:DNA transposition AAA+ family ATPase